MKTKLIFTEDDVERVLAPLRNMEEEEVKLDEVRLIPRDELFAKIEKPMKSHISLG